MAKVQQLRELLTAATHPRALVLTGTAGIGKTTLAQQYAERYGAHYADVHVINARLGLSTEFARLCDELFPQLRNRLDEPQKAERALWGLSQRPPRLLVINNAIDPEHTLDWVPGGDCHTLVLARLGDWTRNLHTLPVTAPDPATATDWLLEYADRKTADAAERAACATLATGLRHLPLALAQAAAWVREQGNDCGFCDYLAQCEHVAANPRSGTALPLRDWPEPLFITWRLAVERLPPLARAILRIGACLAPAPVPVSWWLAAKPQLRMALALLDENTAAHCSEADVAGDAAILAALDCLARYQLATRGPDTIVLHWRAQEIQWDQLLEHSRREWLQLAVMAMGNVLPGDPVVPVPALLPMREHLLALGYHAQGQRLLVKAAQMLNAAGTLLRGTRPWPNTEELLSDAFYAARRASHRIEPATVLARYNLATVQSRERFGFLNEPPLNGLVQACHDNPRISRRLEADILYLRGSIHRGWARPWETAALLAEALEKLQAVYGRNSREMAQCLQELARTQTDLGRLSHAELLMREALAINEAVLEPGHPAIATCLETLAAIFWSSPGEISQREHFRNHMPLAAQAPLDLLDDTATAFSPAAHTLRTAEARQLLHRALAMQEQNFDTGHPEVIRLRCRLGHLLRNTGRPAEAEATYREALAQTEARYGAQHDHVSRPLCALAWLLRETDRRDEAEPLFRRDVALAEHSAQVTGYATAMRLDDLASLLVELGRPAEAEPLLRRALRLYEIYAPDSIFMAECRERLAAVLVKLGRPLEDASVPVVEDDDEHGPDIPF